MKNYLCTYINHTQDNWVDSLLIAEFIISNHINTSRKIIMFFANYGFHLSISIKPSGIYNDEQKTAFLIANHIVKRQNKMIKFMQNQITWM